MLNELVAESLKNVISDYKCSLLKLTRDFKLLKHNCRDFLCWRTKSRDFLYSSTTARDLC